MLRHSRSENSVPPPVRPCQTSNGCRRAGTVTWRVRRAMRFKPSWRLKIPVKIERCRIRDFGESGRTPRDKEPPDVFAPVRQRFPASAEGYSLAGSRRQMPSRFAASTIDLTTVANNVKRKDVLSQIEGINHAVVAHPKPKFRPALQTLVGKGLEPAPQFTNPAHDLRPDHRGQPVQILFEILRPNLRGLTRHGSPIRAEQSGIRRWPVAPGPVPASR